jgi:hypothetical protein
MYDTSEALQKAYKPFDVVTNKKGDVGFIQEVSINRCQPSINSQLSYAVNWFMGNDKHAWFDHDELTVLCNLFVKIAESTCHPMDNNKKHVSQLIVK